MRKILRLTEGDLHKILESSVKRILKEYNGDDESLGRYDIDDKQYDMSDEEYADLQRQLGNKYAEEDEDMKEYFDDLEADQYIGQDYWDPSDNDLYRGTW